MLPNSVIDREKQKFVEDDSGDVAVRVKSSLDTPPLPSGAATAAKQLPDNHQVTVSNPTTNPETGLATSAKQDDIITELQLKADLTETQPVDITAIPTIYNGTKTVPTGTAEAIATSQAIKSVTIKALSTNTVAIYVGATGCTVAAGFELLSGESISLDVDNLATVFVISGSASQVIRYIAI